MSRLALVAALTAVSALAAPAFAQPVPGAPVTYPAPVFPPPVGYEAPVAYEGSVGYTGVGLGGVNVGGVGVRGGVNFGPYWGVEGEGAFGVADDNGHAGGVPARFHLKQQYAGYGVARLPVAPNVILFTRLGYGHTDLKVTDRCGCTVTSGFDSWNYGVGGEYFFDGHNGLRVDYTGFHFEGRGLRNADTWSVAYVYRFF